VIFVSRLGYPSIKSVSADPGYSPPPAPPSGPALVIHVGSVLNHLPTAIRRDRFFAPPPRSLPLSSLLPIAVPCRTAVDSCSSLRWFRIASFVVAPYCRVALAVQSSSMSRSPPPSPLLRRPRSVGVSLSPPPPPSRRTQYGHDRVSPQTYPRTVHIATATLDVDVRALTLTLAS
jgi:hypothetical protein